MKVKIKPLVEGVKIPEYGTEGSAGMDLVATSKRLGTEGYLEFGTSLSFAIPEGFVGLIFPRSSISKKNMQLCNAVGIIDSDFRGEVTFRFKPSTAGRLPYEVGDKVGQMIIMPYPKIEFEEVEDLDETVRGENGYGSTGE